MRAMPALSGRLVSTTPSTRSTWWPAAMSTAKLVQVLLGNKGGLQGDVKVSFQGLDKAAYLREGNQVRVVIERILEDKGGAVTAVQTVVDARQLIRDNSLDVTIPWASDRDASSGATWFRKAASTTSSKRCRELNIASTPIKHTHSDFLPWPPSNIFKPSVTKPGSWRPGRGRDFATTTGLHRHLGPAEVPVRLFGIWAVPDLPAPLADAGNHPQDAGRVPGSDPAAWR